MISVTELRAGTTFKVDDQLYQVIEYRHTKLGRGTANIKVKVRNLKTGTTLERTFISGAIVEEAEVIHKKGQYLYSDSEKSYFMDPQSFEQFIIPLDITEGVTKFLPESTDVAVLFYQNEPLAVELPLKVDLKVTETGPSEKGDTRSAATKEAVLETGYKLQVPMFIKVGDTIRINTETGKYVERLKT